MTRSVGLTWQSGSKLPPVTRLISSPVSLEIPYRLLKMVFVFVRLLLVLLIRFR